MTDLAEFIGPGFAGFALTRFITKVATEQVAKRAPSIGKHAGAAAAVGAFLSAWLLAHKWKWLEKYHTPIVVGAAIAAIQNLIQLYVPSLGWMLADPNAQLPAADPNADLGLPHLQMRALRPVADDPNEYTYNDAYDAGRMSTPSPRPPTAAPPTSATDDLSDLSDIIGDDDYGSLSPNVPN
jgi:hypothetical protein